MRIAAVSSVALGWISLLATAAVSAGTARAADMAAHHAVYALSLAPGNGNGSIAGADGVMTYDLKDVCDGWATDLKLKVIIAFDNGDTRTFEVSQVYWEAKNGKAFRFLTKVGGGGDEASNQTRGEARIDSSGNATVIADLPMPAEAKLPDGTMFPTAQTELVLDKAASGESVVSATVFDGTIPTETAEVSALIGGGTKDWKAPKPFPDLAGHISYPVGLAYFIGDKTDSTPDSEQSLRLFDNGVVGQYDFDFLGGIKIRALLDDLKMQGPAGC